MRHALDVEIATKYGISAAIILEQLYHWVKQNEINNVNFYDGFYWVVANRKLFKSFFPYLSEKKISSAIKVLIDNGLVVIGNYNESIYDRTFWYALTEKGQKVVSES